MAEDRLHRIEPFWDAQLAIVVAVALHAVLPASVRLGPRWLVPAVCAIPLVLLAIQTPYGSRQAPPSRRRWATALAVIGAAGTCNAIVLVRIVDELVNRHDLSAGALLAAGGAVWVSNVALFAVLYWQVDRGGPTVRSVNGPSYPPWPDFGFVQMDDGARVAPGWMPAFVDYLYLSFTNSTAFSPTDVMPLTVRAKLLMLVESAISLVTVLLVAARAVNVLG